MQDIVRDNTAGTLAGTRYYTHNGTPVAMRVGGNNPRYVQSDQQGTAQVTVTTPDFVTTRRTFDPYGNPVGSGQGLWPESRGFLNKPHNPATGLSDIGARKYDPTIGMFISVDPVLDTGNPQQWNPYAYSNNNPVTYSDPSGLYCDGCEFQDGVNFGWGGGLGCGRATNGICGQSGPNDGGYDIRSGQNTDPKQQPSFGGRRLPTFEELKNRPGFHHYMNGGTYREVISDWAKGICTRAISEDQEFCSIAKSYGLLQRDPGISKFMLLIAVGIVLAPIAAECLASALCVRIAGGAFDATTPEGAAFAGASAAGGAAKFIDEAIDFGNAACSFTGDTQVLMADGTTKPIKDVHVGDTVRATDPETGEAGARIVTAVWFHQDTVLELATESGVAIATTEDHPFWNASDGEWQQAQQLDHGDRLLAADGGSVGVAGLRAETIRQAIAYTLSVDDIHTYYVLAGTAPVLVHNCNGPVRLADDVLGTHVLPRHGPGTPGTGSKFNEDLDPGDYEALANEVVRGAPLPARVDSVTGNHAHEFDVGRVIGENGETRVRVWVDDKGNVQTIHPIR